jgi:hypothetical protein
MIPYIQYFQKVLQPACFIRGNNNDSAREKRQILIKISYIIDNRSRGKKRCLDAGYWGKQPSAFIPEPQ